MTFLSIPRTGTMWRNRALKNAGVILPQPGHATAPEARILGFPEPYYVFCRHPVDWWKSVWGYCMLRKWHPGERVFPCTCKSDNFEIFILKVLTTYPGWFSMWVRTYEYQTTMYRMEEMKIVVPDILHNHGIKFDLCALLGTEKLNASPFKPMMTHKTEGRLLKAEQYVMDKYYA